MSRPGYSLDTWAQLVILAVTVSAILVIVVNALVSGT